MFVLDFLNYQFKFLSSQKSFKNGKKLINFFFKTSKLNLNRGPVYFNKNAGYLSEFYSTQTIFFNTKENTNFILSTNGFLYLTATAGYYLNFHLLHNLKKIQFAFGLKNELKKFILKKYLRFKFNFFFNNNEILLDKTPTSASLPFLLPNLVEANYYFNLAYKINSCKHINNDFFFLSDAQNDFNVTGIKRIKFKPGYMSI